VRSRPPTLAAAAPGRRLQAGGVLEGIEQLYAPVVGVRGALMTLADLSREQGRLEDAATYDEQREALPGEPGDAPSS
jgi:hypothetical protein